MMNKKDHAIVVNNLKKTFRIPKDKSPSLKGRILGRTSRGFNEFTPLNEISFEVNQGDFFGIVGRNGSGKSTLLRTIAGIYAPTSGAVHINGSLIPFIELGVGFNPQLSGRENVYLNAALLGFSRQETDEMYDDIVDFAELKDFMEERLQNYSSGMQVRLAFSIAIRAETDILLLDEVLAVGDTAFQEKCFDYFRQLKDEERTVVLVTHNMNHVREFCNRGLVLESGKIKKIGSSEEVADAYGELFTGNNHSIGIGSKRPQKKEAVRLNSIKVSKEVAAKTIEKFGIDLELVQIDQRYENFNVSIEVRNQQDLLVFSESVSNLIWQTMSFNINKPAKISFSVDNFELGNGSYYININVRANKKDSAARNTVLDVKRAAMFRVEGHFYNDYSLIHPQVKVKIKGAITKKIKSPKINEIVRISSDDEPVN